MSLYGAVIQTLRAGGALAPQSLLMKKKRRWEQSASAPAPQAGVMEEGIKSSRQKCALEGEIASVKLLKMWREHEPASRWWKLQSGEPASLSGIRFLAPASQQVEFQMRETYTSSMDCVASAIWANTDWPQRSERCAVPVLVIWRGWLFGSCLLTSQGSKANTKDGKVWQSVIHDRTTNITREHKEQMDVGSSVRVTPSLLM